MSALPIPSPREEAPIEIGPLEVQALKEGLGMFDGLTENQRNVLGNIAINLDTGHNFATLRSLERRGLIEPYKEQLGGRFPVTITRYLVPRHVHIAWCEWCSKAEGQ